MSKAAMKVPKLSAPQIELAKALVVGGRFTSAEAMAAAVTPRNALGLPDPDWHHLIQSWLIKVAQSAIADLRAADESEIERRVMTHWPDKGVVFHEQDRDTGVVTPRKATKAELTQAREMTRAKLMGELPNRHPLRSEVLTEMLLALAVDQDPASMVSAILKQVANGPAAVKAWQLSECQRLMELDPERSKASIAKDVAARSGPGGYAISSLETEMSRSTESAEKQRTKHQRPKLKGKANSLPGPGVLGWRQPSSKSR